jgi:hypothetical protein
LKIILKTGNRRGGRGGRRGGGDGGRGGQQKAEGTQIYIGNLPFSVTWQQLKDSFKEYGEIVRADVAETRNVFF